VPLKRSTSLDLSRPRKIVEIITTALSMYGAYPLLFLGLALAVVAPYELIVLAVTKTAPLGQQTSSLETAVILLLVAFALVGPLVSSLYVHALVAIGRSERPSIATVAVNGVKVLPVVAAAQIIAGIGIGIGFVLFIIPGVFLALRFAVVAQVAAIEGTDWPGALRRSAQLTSRNYLRILGLLVCVYVVNLTVTRLGILIAGSGKGAGPVAVGIVAATLTQSFAALTVAVLYFDLRVRHTDASM
jgi:hypothetical protein